MKVSKNKIHVPVDHTLYIRMNTLLLLQNCRNSISINLEENYAHISGACIVWVRIVCMVIFRTWAYSLVAIFRIRVYTWLSVSIVNLESPKYTGS